MPECRADKRPRTDCAESVMAGKYPAWRQVERLCAGARLAGT